MKQIIYLLLICFFTVTIHNIIHVNNYFCHPHTSKETAFAHYFKLYQALKIKSSKNKKENKHEHHSEHCLIKSAGLLNYNFDFNSIKLSYFLENRFFSELNSYDSTYSNHHFSKLKNKAPPVI